MKLLIRRFLLGSYIMNHNDRSETGAPRAPDRIEGLAIRNCDPDNSEARQLCACVLRESCPAIALGGHWVSFGSPRAGRFPGVGDYKR